MAVLMMAEQDNFTLLGWYVRELMNRKRIKNQGELAHRISVAGYPISQPAVSKILRGKSEPNRRFIAVLATALELDAEERRELADVFSYGDAGITEAITEDNMRGMQEVRERVERNLSQEEDTRGDDRESEVRDYRI